MGNNLTIDKLLSVFLLITIPISAAFGSYLLPFHIAGRTFYAFEVLVIIGFIYIFYKFLKDKSTFYQLLNIKSVKYFAITGIVWVVYGAMTLLWARSRSNVVSEMMIVVFGFLTCAVLFFLISENFEKINYLFVGWIFTFALCSGIAIWEKLTGNHLPGFFEYMPSWFRYRIVTSTFGNPNNLGAFLILSYPILLGGYLLAKNFMKYVSLVLLLVLPFVLVNTEARLSIMTILLEIVIVLLLEIKNRKRFLAILLVNVLMVGVFYLSLLPSINNNNINQNETSEKMDRTLSEIEVSGTSVNVRISMIKNGLYFVKKTHGFGVGAGNFGYMVYHGYGKYKTGHDINPHNFWIEILSEYGVIVFALFVSWFVYIFIKAIARLIYAYRTKDAELTLKMNLLIAGIICYVPAAIENSRYINQPVNWLYLATLVCFSTILSENRIIKKLF